MLEGFNIVGDGTTHNLNAVLNGHNELEMFETRKGIPGRKLTSFIGKIIRRFLLN